MLRFCFLATAGFQAVGEHVLIKHGLGNSQIKRNMSTRARKKGSYDGQHERVSQNIAVKTCPFQALGFWKSRLCLLALQF